MKAPCASAVTADPVWAERSESEKLDRFRAAVTRAYPTKQSDDEELLLALREFANTIVSTACRDETSISDVVISGEMTTLGESNRVSA